MNRYQPVFIGLLAGFAAGLMTLAGLQAGLAASLLVFIAAAAVYIAAMGWGTVAGIIAMATGGAVLLVTGNPGSALMVTVLMFAPAAWVGHLVNLGQPDAEGNMIWFPLSAILMRLIVLLAAGFVLLGLISGFTIDSIAAPLAEMMREIAGANPDLPQLAEDDIKARALSFAKIIPIAAPAIWLMMHAFIALLSAAITRRSGRLARPAEDIAATLNLPAEALGFVGAGLIGTFFLSGSAALLGMVLLGLGVAGYGLIGLADFHYRTRNWAAQGLVLGAAYASIVLLTLPIVIFMVMGLIRSMTALTKRPGPPGPGNT